MTAGALLPLAPALAAAPAVSDGWARATVAGQSSAAGYLTIVNRGPADRLVALRSPRARRVGLHSMSMAGGVMRMRPIAALPIASGGRIELAPGKTHLMLTGVANPLRVGERVPLLLRFERSGEVRAMLEVRPAGAEMSGHAGH